MNICMQTTVSPFAEDICWNRCHETDSLMMLNDINVEEDIFLPMDWNRVIAPFQQFTDFYILGRR